MGFLNSLFEKIERARETIQSETNYVALNYWIGFVFSVVFIILTSLTGNYLIPSCFIPIGFGCLVGAIFSMSVRDKAPLSLVIFFVAAVLAALAVLAVLINLIP